MIISYKYFLHNGKILEAGQAVIPLSNVEYSYGFGVYENIRVSKGKVYFAQDHIKRLMQSAEIIGLEHSFLPEQVLEYVDQLLARNEAETCNIKILLIGGQTADAAQLYILCLNPLFPDRKLYSQGAHTITYRYERMFPHAKTLNMLPSYLAYREARRAGAYDALLVDRAGNITEGTRTNFFALKGKTIYTPPESGILLGVTRDNVMQVSLHNGYEIKESNLSLTEINLYDAAFLTSTSSKIMPITSIDELIMPPIPAELKELINLFNKYLETVA
jgi:branched-chain amino acid aminotransferase